MTGINVWETGDNEQLKYVHNIIPNSLSCNQSYFLDIDKSTTITVIEEYIMDLALYHLTRLNIEDINNYYIEYKLNDMKSSHNFHTNEKNITPLLSCIVFLNDNNLTPFIFTSIDDETYKFKNFENVNEMNICYPSHIKHISHDCKYYHGYINTQNKDVINNVHHFLDIHLWAKDVMNKPDNTMISTIVLDDSTYNYQPCLFKDVTDETQLIKVDNSVTHFEYLNDILYNNHFYHFFKLHLLLYNQSTQVFKCTFNETEDTHRTKLLSDDIYKCKDLSKNRNFKYKYNRFLQRFTFQNVLNYSNSILISNYIQDSIVDLSIFPEDGLIIDTSNSIFQVCLINLIPILDNIKLAYSLQHSNININKIYIVNSSHKFCHATEVNRSLLTVSIHINDDISVQGEYYFQDGLSSKVYKGDAIVFSNIYTKHHILPTKIGNIFILCCDLDIDI